jgi:hypothetical protein
MSTLKVIATRLRTGGRLGIRGRRPDRAYRRALEEVFSTVEIVDVTEYAPEGVIYLAGN